MFTVINPLTIDKLVHPLTIDISTISPPYHSFKSAVVRFVRSKTRERPPQCPAWSSRRRLHHRQNSPRAWSPPWKCSVEKDGLRPWSWGELPRSLEIMKEIFIIYNDKDLDWACQSGARVLSICCVLKLKHAICCILELESSTRIF